MAYIVLLTHGTSNCPKHYGIWNSKFHDLTHVSGINAEKMGAGTTISLTMLTEPIVEKLQLHYNIRHVKIPEYYLGMNTSVTQDNDGWVLATSHYIKKCLECIEKIIGKKLGKAFRPSKQDWHPEE